MGRLAFTLLASAILVCSSGCTSLGEYVRNGLKVGPNYRKPPAPVANEWIDSKAGGIKVEPADLREWWKKFDDPDLNSLIEQAYQQNLTLRTAGTRILAARAQRNIAAGNLFPQLQEAFADVSRNALSGNLANLPPGFRRFFDNNAAGLNLSWEIDFWGRFRRGVEAADAELDASIENYDDAMVLLISDVASTYVQLRVFQQRLEYIEGNIKIQQGFVDQAEERFKKVGRKIDVSQMKSNLTDTRALKEQVEIGLRLANNRLCVLLGVPVRDLTPDFKKLPIPIAPPEAVVGIPADLLRRRPDLRRAERQVAAQSARIGIATSDLYPRFTLIGALGYEAENFGSLFQSKSFAGTIGPNVRWDILNYGRLVNGIRVQDAIFQTRVLEYQNAVLNAGREVEDGIVQYLRSQTQSKHLGDSAKEAKDAVDESVTLSKLVDFDLNRAFVTSNFLVTQQDKLAQSKGDIALGLIQIYRALGGGWELRLTQPSLAAPVVEEAPAPKQKLPPMGGRLLPPQTTVGRSTDAVVLPAQLPELEKAGPTFLPDVPVKE
jgi:NodT family efflux transporter outer membrane factor (OMF) lipoprotein